MRLSAIPAMIVALSLSLVACTQDKPSTDSNLQTTQEVKQTNSSLPTHVALTDVPYPPYEMRGEDGTIVGMEIEIFDAIAKDQKFNITYIPHVWDGIFDTMNEDEDAKFVVSAVTMVEEAREKALLSEPYYFSPYRIASLDPEKLTKWQSLKIGISSSEDSADDLPTMGVKPENLVTYNTVFSALAGLIRGEVDVVVADSTVLLYHLSSESVKEFRDKLVSDIIRREQTNGSQLVFAVDKANPELLDKINAGLKNIKASGELERILTKYGQTDTYSEFLKINKDKEKDETK